MEIYTEYQHELEFYRALSERKEVDDRIDSAVRQARADGHSWEKIAGWLGVTKQAAHKRYSAGEMKNRGEDAPARPELEGQFRLLE